MSGSTNSISNSNSSSNCTNTNANNNNDNVPEDGSLFKYYMEKCFVLPLELKNDIVYCQRALRDFLKVHGLVSDVFKDQADADPIQMQIILEELEAEIYEINAEQQYLMLRLTDDLDKFYKKLEENNIQTVPDVGNEYISSLIVPLIGDTTYKIYPQSVLSRDNEEMLIRKHFLISQDEEAGIEPLKLSELDDNVPLMLVNPLTIASVGKKKEFVDMQNDLDTKLDDLCKSQATSSAKLSLMSSHPMPSLKLAKKEKCSLPTERDLKLDEGSDMENAAQVSLPPPPVVVASKTRTVRTDSKPQLKRNSTSPPPLAPITKEPLPTIGKEPSAVCKSESPSKEPASAVGKESSMPDFEVVAQSRMNLRQALRRARKTKQQPRKFDDEDSLELTNDKIFEEPIPLPPASVPIKGKLAKSPDGVPPASSATAAMSKKAAQQASSKQYKTRNAYGAGRKPLALPAYSMATPPATAGGAAGATTATTAGSLGSSGSSDDSHQELELEQQRLCASAAQWRDEPRETRVLPAEYGREQFLGMFELYTHDMVKKLCQRHSKRKRRTVQNASGVDFHYGQQLANMDNMRQKKLKEKPEFLLSPKEKRLQAKKAQKAAVAAAGRKSKSKSPEKLEDLLEVGKSKIKESKKRADNLLTCQSCNGQYQSDSVEDAKAKTQTNSPTQSQGSYNHAQLNGRCSQCIRDGVLSGRAKHVS